MSKKKIVIICGPTASGKTGVSIEIAKRFNGEVICADSMQIYDEMSVGTAKPTPEEMEGVPHRMFGFVSPDTDYNVSLYKKDAFENIDELLASGKLPLVVGGTGLYINSLIYDIDFTEGEPDNEFRTRLSEIYDSEGGKEKLYAELAEKDPESVKRIHINDKKRIIRRLEILESGKTEDYDFYKPNTEYDFLILAINKNRDHLYSDIELRIDIMEQQGLYSEVKALYDKYGSKINAFLAIGYKEFIPMFNGEKSLSEVLDTIKLNTRHFAKRQLTWFRKNKNIVWFNIDDYSDRSTYIDSISDTIKEFLEK